MFLLTQTAEMLSTTVQGVTAIGFPAFMCIIMMKYMQENDNNNRAELKAVGKALENNSLVITQLMERIDKLNERIGEDK